MNGSMKRRRWSNELLGSLIDFQSKEASEQIPVDSLEGALAALKVEESPEGQKTPKTPGTVQNLDVSLDSTVLMTDSGNESEKSLSDLINFSSMGSNNLSQDLNKSLEDMMNNSDKSDLENRVYEKTSESKVFNGNERLIDNIIIKTERESIEISSPNFSSQNSTEVQSMRSQTSNYSTGKSSAQISLDSGRMKYFSCGSSSQNSTDVKSAKSQTLDAHSFNPEEPIQSSVNSSFDGNEKINESGEVSSSSEQNKYTSCQSSPQNIAVEKLSNQESSLLTTFKKDQSRRFFSSPVEFLNSEEMITDMNEPDVWDALLELEQALSPVEESDENSKEQSQNPSSLLTRLSQKFKQTPTRFTEKFVSIIEDSIISVESPTKANPADISGISLHRMTGEFRKLCKFIEDESMPDLDPSLMNTYLEKADTPEYEKIKNRAQSGTPKNRFRVITDTPPHKFTPKALRNLITPKNKIRSNVCTPINRYTPTADKSFEYWENVCNMICPSKDTPKKKEKIALATESSKRSMNEMLTICERQLASLDDSTADIRCSEPCKKTDRQIVQVPRSKSVSKLYGSNQKEEKVSSVRKQKNKKIAEKLNFDDFDSPEKMVKANEVVSNEIIESRNEDGNLKFNQNNEDSDLRFNQSNEDSDSSCNQSEYHDESDLLICSSKESEAKSYFERKEKTLINSYNSDEQDCSLLIELAKRRQRCLETAKLMMEIDSEDPTMTEDDNKCMETLYKLGIQDKTVAEVEDDVKFLSTLGQCIDYKNYFRENSKPIYNMLQSFESPEKLDKTTSIIKSKNLIRSARTSKIAQKTQISRFDKPNLESKILQKTVEKKIITRTEPKSFSRSVPRTNPRLSKATPTVKTTSKITPSVNRKNFYPQLNKKNLLSQFESEKNVTSDLRTPSRTSAMNQHRSTQPKKAPPKPTPKVLNKNSVPKVSQPKRMTSRLNSKILVVNYSLKQEAKNPSPKTTSRALTPKLTPKEVWTPKLTPKVVLSPQSTPKEVLTPKSIPKVLTPKVTPNVLSEKSPFNQNITEQKRITPTATLKTLLDNSLVDDSPLAKKLTPKDTTKFLTSKILITPEKQPVLQEKTNNIFSKPTPKSRLFISPGKSPSAITVIRKKPASYFSDGNSKKYTPQKDLMTPGSVKSPIGLYVNGTDTQLVQNVRVETNEWLLTPVADEKDGTPRLRINLAAKENKSPRVNFDESIHLPAVNYESTPKKRVYHDKPSYSPSLITPNSRKNLLGEVENTVVIRHEGRVIDPFLDTSRAETSVLVQKMADKTPINRRRYL